MSILLSLLPILAALLSGIILGKWLPKSIIRLINPLVWLLLLFIGYQFGEVFLDENNAISQTLYYALIFSGTNSLLCFVAVYIWRWKHHQEQRQLAKSSSSVSLLLNSLKEPMIALSIVALGIILFALTKQLNWTIDSLIIDGLLYALIFVVGVDVRHLDFRASLSKNVLLLPLFVVFASLLAGILCSIILNENVALSLAISSGFGWFTLSGVLVASEVSPWYGTVALLSDLFRELIAILLLYTLSQRYSYESVAVSGATALDSTLPMIKQNYASDIIPMAIISGLVLTLLAPVMMGLFLAFV